MEYSYLSYLDLPYEPGVYQFLDENNIIIYVGKAKSLKDRVSSYFVNKTLLAPKTKVMVEQIRKIRIVIVESEIESLLLEANLIKKYKPKYNIRLIDNKAYPLIRITLKSDFPAVLISRSDDDPKSVYFGPYPDSKAVRMVLRFLRRIFPFQSVLNHPKTPCLYHHLNLCPCLPAFNTPENRKIYIQNLKRIIQFLNGDSKKILKELENDRNNFSKIEDFENAAKTQIQINAIERITSPRISPFEYETNPNLIFERRDEEIKALMEILNSNGIKTNYLHRIECYDNSNIQGTNPTSSMVVLTDGEIDKSQYRKFKVRTIVGPNDFGTMKEILKRRFKHDEWALPDLLVMDGGKGQVSSAKEVLESLKLKAKSENNNNLYLKLNAIPLIGLAKREEIIVTSDLSEIKIPHTNPGLKLLMKIRDEAHRFAITYHRKLRSKTMI